MEQMAGAGISGARLRELVSLLAAGHEYKFYSWPEWRALRLEVLRLDRYECQHCKAAGVTARGTSCITSSIFGSGLTWL